MKKAFQEDELMIKDDYEGIACLKTQMVRSALVSAFILLVGFLTCFLVSIALIKTFGKSPNGVDQRAASKEIADIEELQKNGIVYYDADQVPLIDGVQESLNLRGSALQAYSIVNEIRTDAGLNPLSWNGSLENCSSIRAVESSQLFSHTRPNGQNWWTVDSRIMGGENLAYGYDNPDEVVQAWMNSPTHAQNILYKDFREVAITVYQTGDGVTYWAQEFGY